MAKLTALQKIAARNVQPVAPVAPITPDEVETVETFVYSGEVESKPEVEYEAPKKKKNSKPKFED